MTLRSNSTPPANSVPSASWRRLGRLLAWPWELVLLLLVFGWLYRQTLPPGISSWMIEGWDSAMLQITGSTWGIPHSPGYPLYIILSNLFVRLMGLIPGLSDTTVVWRVSFWSTATSLFALIFVYLTIRRLNRGRAAAVIAGSLLGLSFIFWRAAIMAEVYSLNALIFALTYWLAILWYHHPRRRRLVALGLILGAGLAHHRTAFILPPTIALWVALKYFSPAPTGAQTQPYKSIIRSWLILAGAALIPLLTYLYLPWAARYRVGLTWLYADVSDWNTFWFVVLAREWWGLVTPPHNFQGWSEALQILFWQQAGQITAVGVIAGLIGLIASRRYLWLFGPPVLALVFFGVSYRVADLDSMLIPLTLTLCLGVGILVGIFYKIIAYQLITLLRVQDEVFRGKWLVRAGRWTISIGLLIGAYFLFRPLAEANYAAVDLSSDWQAVDLVEEVVAIAETGTPLTIIGQDNSVLPDFIYTQVVLNQPVEPLSTTGLSRMPEEASIALLQNRFNQGRRILVDIETIELGFIPWLNEAIETGQIFKAPTGHPYLWELLPRPMGHVLPEYELWTQIPPGQFLDGQISIIAYHQQVVHKRTGCFLRLTLFWRAEKYIEGDYYVSVQPLGGETVLDKNDHLALMRGYLPTSQMRPGEIVRDEIDMLIRQPAALPGVMLVVNLYQIQGNQFPTFGQVTLPIEIDPEECK
ncbi:MAG: DUF2723 domain-containing protein [Anaerolineae bacterium]|nr:DUF2723 domain-containing protein [Anaerolineae bacterium]